MKQLLCVCLCCLLCLSLLGCQAEAPAPTSPTAAPTVPSATVPQTLPAALPAEAALPAPAVQEVSQPAYDPEALAYYRALDRQSPEIQAYDAVMNANVKFTDAYTGTAWSVSSLLQQLSTGSPVVIRQLTVTDLGQEGIPELILWLSSGTDQNFGFLVLRYDGGQVYGYSLDYRQFAQLKTDGTFQTGDSSSYGYGTMVFQGSLWEVSRSIPGSPEADAAQAEKPDAIWFAGWDSLFASDGIGKATFSGVFNGSDPVTSTATQEALPLRQIGTLLLPADAAETQVRQLAAVDLDQDGEKELVLQITAVSEEVIGCVILRKDGSRVVADGYYYRPFHDLKADGTYRFSGSSTDCGYGCKRFVNGQWQEIILAQRYATAQHGGGSALVYFVNGQMTDEAGFAAFEQAQNAKEEVRWYDSWESCLAANPEFQSE